MTAAKLPSVNSLQLQVNVGVIQVSWRTCADGSARVTQIDWSEAPVQVDAPAPVIPACVADLIGRLARYFESGTPIGELDWNMIDQEEWSPFQKAVYQAISAIPHGETRTYGWVAKKIRKFAATRAVGQSLRYNPLPIVIPCHRVVSHDSLGGFMGCSDLCAPEMRLKSALIRIEDTYCQPVFPLLGPIFMATVA